MVSAHLGVTTPTTLYSSNPPPPRDIDQGMDVLLGYVVLTRLMTERIFGCLGNRGGSGNCSRKAWH